MTILVIHFAATVFMTGVIWLVQVVSYPQLNTIESSEFKTYEKSHMKRISWVVGPMMLLEFFTALYLLVNNSLPEEFRIPFYASLVLGIIIVVSTAMIQAPLHGQLAQEGKIVEKIAWLIKSNWIRTFCWTGRSFLIGWIVLGLL